MVLWVILYLTLKTPGQAAENADPGRKAYETRCVRCHGADGNGGEMGPPMALRLAAHDDGQLAALIRGGVPARGTVCRRAACRQARSRIPRWPIC
jgi:mono/diheme cytochrome c family protein